MSPPWESAQPVDEARAAALVGAQFPALRGAPVRAVATGWDNSVLLVGDVLFRFPRREVAVELQQRELAVLPLLAELPLAVPRPTHLGAPAGDYPWPFWGGPLIPGSELAQVACDRVAAAEAVGAFLRALHSLQVDVVLPMDPNSRGAPADRAARTHDWLDRLAARGIWHRDAAVEAVVDVDLGTPTPDPVLVHGDLHPRHLLVLPDGSPTGVIDWGDTCFADRAVDLSLAWSAFEGPARDAMLAAYGPVSADTEARGRALAVSLCAALAAWAADAGEAVLLEEYLAGIARAAH